MNGDQRVLVDFARLSLLRKIVVVLTFGAAWIFLDLASGFLTTHQFMCGWYPNSGISLGFAVFFGWPVIILEAFFRTVMAIFYWQVNIGILPLLSYAVLPALSTLVLSTVLRRAIVFAGGLNSMRVAWAFVLVTLVGGLIRGALLQFGNTLTGILAGADYLINVAIWFAGDMIGMVTLTPFVLMCLGPWLVGDPVPLFERKRWPAFVGLIAAFVVFICFLTHVVPDRHFHFWHLVIALHLAGACTLGFRWMTLQVVIVNFALSLVEFYFASQVVPLEQQFFLTMVTGGGLVLAILFDDRSIHLRNIEVMTRTLADTAQESMDFTNIFSHELRTPLTVILGYSSLVQRTPGAVANPQRLDRVRVHAQALKRLLSQLLLLGNPQGAREASSFEKVDLREFISEAVGKSADEAGRKGLELQWDSTRVPSPFVLQLGAGVRIALEELIGNAVKFTDKGVVRVSADVEEAQSRRGEHHDSLIRIRVEDSGIGMDSEFSPFLPFEQEAGGLTRPKGGLGIGLAVCQLLLESLDGKVYVEKTERHVGSVFVMEFPGRQVI